MIITRRSTQKVGLLPEAYTVLSPNFSIPIYNTDHGLRVPLGIYNVSLNSIFSGFTETLNAFDRLLLEKPFLEPSTKAGWDTALLENHKTLLYSLFEHTDDCHNILKCFFRNTKECKKDIAVITFSKSICEYRDHIAKIVNQIKHNQSRLRGIIFYNDNEVVPGYFVEGVSEEGGLGPHKEIHKDGNTAFSFSRDLRLHFYGLYMISHHLSEAVRAITNTSKPHADATPAEKKRVSEIATRISKLPAIVFPDETLKPFPEIKITKEKKSKKSLQIIFPSKSSTTAISGQNMTIEANYSGDGATRSFAIPYSHIK